MQSKIKFFLLLISITAYISSCHKNNSAPVKPITDTLGIGWQRIKVDSTMNFTDIFFPTSQIGFLAGEHYLGKSTDGGLSWQQTPVTTGYNQIYFNLFFIDANTGWVVGNGSLYQTKDGGNSWKNINSSPLYDVQFFDANNGYATSNNGFFKTTDGGVTFQPVYTTGPTQGLFFLNKNLGCIYNAATGLAKTTDGGLTTRTPNPSFKPNAGILQFTDTLNGWTAGPGVYKTIDGGLTFTEIIPPTGGGDVQFFDSNNGFIMSPSAIYSTNDGGKTLTKLCAIHKTQLIEFHFTDPNHGWATGLGGFVYRYVKS